MKLSLVLLASIIGVTSSVFNGNTLLERCSVTNNLEHLDVINTLFQKRPKRPKRPKQHKWPKQRKRSKQHKRPTSVHTQNKVYLFPINFVIFVDPVDNTGFLTETEIDSQINSTNSVLKYSNSTIKVKLYNIRYVYSTELFNNCGLYKHQQEYRKIYSVSPESILNVYVCSISVLGFIMYFPTQIADNSIWNGIHVDYRAFPSINSFDDFNEGDTLTHEFGHYLGLLHTFNNNNCDGDNDGIDDTPIEKNAGYGKMCFQNIDSCPQAGIDPLYNIMDYTDDSCIREFTPLQNQLMVEIIKKYKPRTIVSQN